jgi:hypothetical protein
MELLTNPIHKKPSSEAAQVIRRTEVHCHGHKTLSVGPIQIQMNPIHNLTSDSLKIHFIIIILPKSRSYNLGARGSIVG